jgi:hypothetical protein
MKTIKKLFFIKFFLILSFTAAIGQNSNYIPPGIKFLSPANGSVLPTGTNNISVTGVILKGSKDISQLSFNDEPVIYDEQTFKFTHTIEVDPNLKFQTFYYDVKDKDLFIKKIPLCLSFGEKHMAGKPSVVDNAVSVNVTDDLVDIFGSVASDFINFWKYDLIYGWNGYNYSSHDENSPFKSITPVLPIVVDKDIPGKIVINQHAFVGGEKQGLINFGDMNLFINTQTNGQIIADMQINPENGVKPGAADKALYVQGYHEYKINLGFWDKTVRTNIYVSATGVSVSGGTVTMVAKPGGEIQTKISFNRANIRIHGLKIKYGDLTIPDFLEKKIYDVVKKTISKIDFSIPIFDTKEIKIPIEGLNLATWPMKDSIFELNDGDLYIDMGVHTSFDQNVELENPALDHFMATPSHPLPDLTPKGNENLIISLSDDMANQAAYVIYQSGVINDLDILENVKSASNQYNNEALEASVKLGVPTICDFSNPTRNFDAGRFIVRNVQLDIKNYEVLKNIYVNAVLGFEGEFALKLKVNETGTEIMAGIDFDRSRYDIKVLYSSIQRSNEVLNGLFDLGDKVLKDFIQKVIVDTVKLEIPPIELYGLNIQIHLIGTEFIDGNLIARVFIEAKE